MIGTLYIESPYKIGNDTLIHEDLYDFFMNTRHEWEKVQVKDICYGFTSGATSKVEEEHKTSHPSQNRGADTTISSCEGDADAMQRQWDSQDIGDVQTWTKSCSVDSSEAQAAQDDGDGRLVSESTSEDAPLIQFIEVEYV